MNRPAPALKLPSAGSVSQVDLELCRERLLEKVSDPKCSTRDLASASAELRKVNLSLDACRAASTSDMNADQIAQSADATMAMMERLDASRRVNGGLADVSAEPTPILETVTG